MNDEYNNLREERSRLKRSGQDVSHLDVALAEMAKKVKAQKPQPMVAIA